MSEYDMAQGFHHETLYITFPLRFINAGKEKGCLTITTNDDLLFI